jgi:hypothetical protein
MQTVADEAGHRDAAVLDLGVAQPADGVLVASAPEICVSKAEPVRKSTSDFGADILRDVVSRSSRISRRSLVVRTSS